MQYAFKRYSQRCRNIILKNHNSHDYLLLSAYYVQHIIYSSQPSNQWDIFVMHAL